MTDRIIVLCAAFILDLLIGDPHFMWHPVQGMGKIIEYTERALRRIMHIHEERDADRGKKIAAGVCIVLVTIGISLCVPVLIIELAGMIHPYAALAAEAFMCYQMLAMKSLRTESMKVYHALAEGDVEKARHAVSMIVGRDTEPLTEEGITRAAVETVAEITSDGVVAPLLYMALFGACGGFVYKAVNTMDSMIGYKNDRYIYMGKAAAKLDDVVNYIPARISALSMIAAAFFMRYHAGDAWRIFRRDRYRHSSPNSAQTEAVCAGALSIQLAGDAWYFGELYSKPTIGDNIRPVEPEDIRRVNRLMYTASCIVLIICVAALLSLRILL